MERWTKEDSRDLIRVRIANHPVTKAREMNTMKRLLEADDRMLGITSREKPKKTLYTWLFIDEDKEYTEKELKYRQWMIGQLIDNSGFMDSFSFSPSLGSHKTKYFEMEYIFFFRANPRKQYGLSQATVDKGK